MPTDVNTTLRLRQGVGRPREIREASWRRGFDAVMGGIVRNERDRSREECARLRENLCKGPVVKSAINARKWKACVAGARWG